MVVCKFFLQGYCRYGYTCKFEHQLNGKNFVYKCSKYYILLIVVADTYTSSKPNKIQLTSILWQSQLSKSQDHSQSNTTYHKQNNIIFDSQDNKPPNTSANVDVETLIKAVINDMTAFEHSKQWLLSCYGPFKEKPVFPGFEDYSFEEIRLGFYEAIKNGNIEQYVSIN